MNSFAPQSKSEYFDSVYMGFISNVGPIPLHH